MSETRTGTAPTVLRMVLGKRLGHCARRRGCRARTAADVLDVTPLTIRRMEKSEVGLKLPYVGVLLRTYGVAESGGRGVPRAGQGRQPARLVAPLPRRPARLVQRLRQPGERSQPDQHLRTPLRPRPAADRGLRAGRAAERDSTAIADELERRVGLRVKRQHLLTKPEAPTLWILLEEAVLRRPVGGPDVMRAQVDRLLEASRHAERDAPDHALRRRRASRGVRPLPSLPLRHPELPDIVYTENLTGAVYLDQRADVAAYLEVLDNMSARAAASAGRRAFLQEIRKEL